MTIVAGEGTDETGPIGPAPQRKAGQVQAGGPSLGPAMQPGDVLGREAKVERLVEQCSGLRFGEAKIVGTDLDELASDPQARQGQRWIGASGKDQAQRRGEVLE